MTCMDDEERDLITKALSFLGERDPDTQTRLQEELGRVDSMATMANSFPSLLESGQAHRDRLVDSLCQVDSGMSAFSLPIRAVMGDAFLTAKIQLLMNLRKALQESGDEVPPALTAAANHEVAQSIYTMLLSTLLWDVVRHRELPEETRFKAALELVYMWEKPTSLEIDDFFPMLEAAWQARNKITVIYGTLVGASEFFQLIRANCPERFTEYFTRDDIPPEEYEAFQEFLFGLPQEELTRLKQAMKEKGVNAISSGAAKGIVKNMNTQDEHTPEALFASYRRRIRAAKLRRLIGAPGPRQTAEGYMMLQLLTHENHRSAEERLG